MSKTDNSRADSLTDAQIEQIARNHCHDFSEADVLPYLKAAIYEALDTVFPVAQPAAAPMLSPDECEQDVYRFGRSIGLFDIPKETANAICAQITAVTGTRVDWHYIAGRVHMKALVATPAAPTPEDERAAFVKFWCDVDEMDAEETAKAAFAAGMAFARAAAAGATSLSVEG
ncbi:hypothetical protein [Burkholderia contaminans]|uniref:Uncharacterized protein n=1 Tax=Burkholderia contaminans TaxID=488447 RepID=A0A3N8S2I6_9BURK|nr:hypothetical protein [Burkholderia contaminans]RQT26129.1 hypothetical protein DF037_20790 [Burkholderia contaminans]